MCINKINLYAILKKILKKITTFILMTNSRYPLLPSKLCSKLLHMSNLIFSTYGLIKGAWGTSETEHKLYRMPGIASMIVQKYGKWKHLWAEYCGMRNVKGIMAVLFTAKIETSQSLSINAYVGSTIKFIVAVSISNYLPKCCVWPWVRHNILKPR